MLRTIPGPAGFSAMFLLPILAGYCYGPTFGFLLGALSLLVSAFIGGGVGPWMPYQMFSAGWVGMLSGWLPEIRRHPRAESIVLAARKVVAQVEQQIGKSEITTPQVTIDEQVDESEDSVVKDIKTAKKLVGGVVKGISKKVEPVAQDRIEKAATSGIFKKLIKILLILIFMIILLFIGFTFFRTVQDGNGGGNGIKITPFEEITPTPYVYKPYKPSVYAEDPEVLILEQDINSLEKEIFRAIIREDKLFPPVLDFKGVRL